LGGGSIITDETSKTYQTLAYAPYGESLVNVRNGNDYDERHQFTGYEKDEETGLSQAKNRYYDSKLSIFYSVDALAEKFPNIAGYAYCANNPIRYIDPDGNAAVDALGSPPQPYMKTVGDCFGNDLSSADPFRWLRIPSVIPANQFIGWGHNGIKNCYTLANFQLSVVGYSSTSKHYQAYTEQKGVNKEQAQNAVEYIKKSLTAGKPVMVGVDDQDGHPGNADKTTDHWIVIVGMDKNDKGNYFNFYDNATSNQKNGTSAENKLYYDADTGKLTGTADNNYSRGAQRDYTVTRVKETKQNTTNTNSQ
jgi:RHS repeat-associated protein